MRKTMVAGLVLAGVVGSGVAGGTATAAQGSAPETPVSVAGSFDCGILTCSYVFSKKDTNTIADDGLAAAGLCSAIPTPGNGACAAGFAIVVVTAKVAKSQGKCVRFTAAKIAPYGLVATPDGGSRCQ
ncbi:hypothetical protein [Amycolatopsis magusensis]|uniref:hypothetical protein n=1 Tax=Amycolatopsis magusensis TaxID=882444 RepID=UPI003C2CB9D7